MYDFLSVRSFSTILGFIEIETAVLIAVPSVFPKASAVGSVLAIGAYGVEITAMAARRYRDPRDSSSKRRKPWTRSTCS
jgi:hypothetical protein